ncbi:protein of unknown function DUF336 [Halopiger xanaduensis SH-6]|uniref:ATP/cobalamin adenosyltransferase n=2 Tax=Halopiger xanaduensis TaxID=387343 RepID=F8D7P2_HALXS|nr:protein of unknown function DUF336 [Halopiger xanaduensis SH-6]
MQRHPVGTTSMVDSVPLETAKAVIDAAEQRADEIDNPMVITVANSEGNLVAQHRMDGAWLASVDISRNKAYTAAALDMPTDELAEPTKPGESLYGLQNTNQGRMVIFGGGYPLERDGEVVGAIGVSGGEVAQDMDVAQSGVDKFDDLSS